MPSNRSRDLQAIRGLAIVLVLLHHLSLPTTLINFRGGQLPNPFFWGVELFFVLSGFVVTKSLISKDYNPFYFACKRVFRLYPAIFSTIILATILNCAVANSSYSPFAIDLFSMPSDIFNFQSFMLVIGGQIVTGMAPAYQYGQMWSLSVEFQYYAALAILLLFLRTLQTYPKDTAVAIGAALILMFAFLGRQAMAMGYSDQAPSICAYLAGWKFDFIAAGVLLAYAPKQNLSYALSKISSRWIQFLAVLGTCILLTWCRSTLSPVPLDHDYLNIFGMTAILATSLYLVALGAVGFLGSNRETKLIWRLFVRLGDYSYTIYLLHFSIFVLSWMVIEKFIPSAFSNPMVYGIAQLVTVVLIAIPFVWFCYSKIELKGIELGEQFYARVKQAIAR